MNPIRVGTYVTHSMRPGWGVGKVFGQSAQHVLVGFSGVPEAERFKRLEWRVGLLEKAEVKSDPELDSWKVECDSTCHYLGATPKAKRVAKPKVPKVAKVGADVKAAGTEPVAAKDAKAPIKEAKSAAKEVKAPVKEAKSAAKEVKAPAKAAMKTAALKNAVKTAKAAPKVAAKVAAKVVSKPAAKAAKPAKPAKKKR